MPPLRTQDRPRSEGGSPRAASTLPATSGRHEWPAARRTPAVAPLNAANESQRNPLIHPPCLRKTWGITTIPHANKPQTHARKNHPHPRMNQTHARKTPPHPRIICAHPRPNPTRARRKLPQVRPAHSRLRKKHPRRFFRWNSLAVGAWARPHPGPLPRGEGGRGGSCWLFRHLSIRPRLPVPRSPKDLTGWTLSQSPEGGAGSPLSWGRGPG